MEETRSSSIHTPAVAVGGMALTPGKTLASFEGIWHAEPVATVGDQGVGLTAAGRVTGGEEGTVEDA